MIYVSVSVSASSSSSAEFKTATAAEAAPPATMLCLDILTDGWCISDGDGEIQHGVETRELLRSQWSRSRIISWGVGPPSVYIVGSPLLKNSRAVVRSHIWTPPEEWPEKDDKSIKVNSEFLWFLAIVPYQWWWIFWAWNQFWRIRRTREHRRKW